MKKEKKTIKEIGFVIGNEMLNFLEDVKSKKIKGFQVGILAREYGEKIANEIFKNGAIEDKKEQIKIILNDDGTWEFEKECENEEIIILYPDGTWKYASDF